METPLETRAKASDAAREGVVAQSGLSALRAALANNASGFAAWRGNPMTKVLLKALQHTLVHPPATLAGNDALVQYGVTQGLTYALHLFTDPSVLWPGVFGGSASVERKLPEMDFEAPLDAALV